MKKKLNLWRLTGCILYILFFVLIIRLAFVFPQNKSLVYTVCFCLCIIGIGLIVFGLPGTYCFYKANKKKKKTLADRRRARADREAALQQNEISKKVK